MRHLAFGALLFAGATAILSTTAQAAPMMNAGVAAASHNAQIETVQWRRGWHGGHRGGWGGRRYGYHRGWGRGAAVGAGIAGLAAGALIAGSLANPPPVYEAEPVYPAGDASAYCARQFKSWDPATGTYLGYDGLRHPCP